MFDLQIYGSAQNSDSITPQRFICAGTMILPNRVYWQVMDYEELWICSVVVLFSVGGLQNGKKIDPYLRSVH